ncbi:collagen alpha-2(I) chain-like [Protopterus annectens]|uniref:collagen alpha-2(I) chain-like n=1 Tax=Protopterus annectens TaxID=7888 RepID=UPI001CFB3185|nr:collagen alpha-2(I) chain-like [Protopterus annectens]
MLYSSDKPSFHIVWAVLNGLDKEVRLLIDPPNGTKENPATTCKELLMCHPDLPDGYYYIDPNQGCPLDSLLVYCNFTAGGETCIFPSQDQVPMKAWLKEYSRNRFEWLSLLPGAISIEYSGAGTVQLRFLKLNSAFVSQKVTYSCKSSSTLVTDGNKQRQRQKDIKFLANTREQSFLGTLTECSDGAEGVYEDTVFHFATEQLDLLPLRDLAIFNIGDDSQEFSFIVGPVCFS